MDARDDGEVSKPSPWGSRRRQAAASISSLSEAWLRALDRCVIATPLSETVLPLMRNCFFGGAAHAVQLLQKGHGDQLAADIASFLMEVPQSIDPMPSASGIYLGVGNSLTLARPPVESDKISGQINLKSK
jgi:hypothetical protein